MKLRFLFLIPCLFYSTANFALFCPNSVAQIELGDSIDQVTQACGAPTSKKTYKATENVPQEWTYYVNMVKSQNGSIKMVIAFDKDGNVINMSVNGAGVTNTAICGSPITLNNTQDQIKKACGDPAYINKSAPADDDAKKPAEMTEFTYDGISPAVLVFKDGKLIQSK